jgi:hypothetical protein
VRLYHGSNVAVLRPRILVPRRALDFGPGFYVTSSLNQARAWARIKQRRARRGEPTVTSYGFDADRAAKLSSLVFDAPDEEWLDFVAANRRAKAIGRAYDLVVGPVANDNTLPVIDDYMGGTLTKDEAVRRLLPHKLVDQYALPDGMGAGMSDECGGGIAMTVAPARVLDFLDRSIVLELMRRYGFSELEALRRYLRSETYRLVADDELKFWHFAPLAVLDLWETERATGDPRDSVYLRDDDE